MQRPTTLGIPLKGNGFLYDEAINAFENFIRHAPPEDAERVEEIRKLITKLKGGIWRK